MDIFLQVKIPSLPVQVELEPTLLIGYIYKNLHIYVLWFVLVASTLIDFFSLHPYLSFNLDSVTPLFDTSCWNL